jgi:hypothetical protein
VPRGQRDGSLRPYSWSVRPDGMTFYVIKIIISRAYCDSTHDCPFPLSKREGLKVCPLVFLLLLLALQPFVGPWRFLQFINPVHSL